jgi:cell division protease FtsH
MSTGASKDLERATALARRMVTEFGMSERLGVVALGPHGDAGESKQYSEQTAQAIDDEVRRLIDEAYAKARTVIVEHRLVLDRLAQVLLQRETLQGQELERAFAGELPARQPDEAPRTQPAWRPTRLPSGRLLPDAAMSLEADPR